MSVQIEEFLTSPVFAVIGASTNRQKFGNKVLRCYMRNHKKVIPVNPKEAYIEGLQTVKDIDSLPEEVQSISIVTPPDITEIIVDQAIKKGIRNIWMQPGAESDQAIIKCLEKQLNVIARGPCILVELGF